MTHEIVHYEDGRFRVPTLPMTLKALVRHASQFGTDGVLETAEAEALAERDLTRLRIELDALDAGRKSNRGFRIGKRRRRSADETRGAVLALSVDGLVPKAISDKLGLSDGTVRLCRTAGATAVG